ncbi:MAG: amidohydrolase family protein, partial [Acidimicrobiales bacterium]
VDPCAGAAGLPLQLTVAELEAVVAEASRLGYDVVAHAEGLDGCEAAVRLGLRTIEHGMYLHRRPDILAAMAEAGITLVPTFSSSYWNAGRDDQVGVEGEGDHSWTDELDRNAHLNITESERTIAAARAAGTPIALGGDAWHNRGGVWIELLRMIHHGMPVLASATSVAARAIGLGDFVGTVEPGKLADLVVVDGDPTAEPSLLGERQRIWLVVQLGTPVAGAALEAEVGGLASPAAG